MTKKFAPLLLLPLFALLMAACDDSEHSTSAYSVYYHCDLSYSPYNQVTSYGSFVTLRRKDASSYYITDITGKTTTVNLTETEARQGFFYGLGGLIIGTPSLCDGNVWAFDWACPTCDRAKYRLTVSRDGTGKAVCPNCGNEYDLNSGGILTKGSGRKLWVYGIMRSGSQLFVQN